MISFTRAVVAFVLGAAAFGGLAWVIVPASASPERPTAPLGAVGSAVVTQALTEPPVATNLDPMTPEQITPMDSPCVATLTEVRSRLPKDYGTVWLWGRANGEWAGKYFPGRNVVVLQADQPCEYVPIVVTHEWMHQLQDITGTFDYTMVNGYNKGEIVAECAARVIAKQQEWPFGKSYPELTGVACVDVANDVDQLLAMI